MIPSSPHVVATIMTIITIITILIVFWFTLHITSDSIETITGAKRAIDTCKKKGTSMILPILQLLLSVAWIGFVLYCITNALYQCFIMY